MCKELSLSAVKSIEKARARIKAGDYISKDTLRKKLFGDNNKPVSKR
ncbi:MAG: hypothetical protein PHH82_01715 [Candidatus ainarchaeum sp.]|nr:hypothetical protein [Candidatus ainarchaeum sp.]